MDESSRSAGALPIISWIRASVRRQIAVVLVAILALFAFNVFITFQFISSQKADAGVVNIAGRQRMLSQKMSKEAFSLEAGDEGSREALAATTAEFDSTLSDLRNGNAERGITPPPASVVPQLDKIAEAWAPFYEQAKIVDVVSVSNPEFDDALQHVLTTNGELLTSSNQAVSLYAAAGAPATVLDIAGRQRMLSQKMSKEAFAVATGDQASRDALAATATEFDTNLKDLISGNAARGITPPPATVRPQLDTVLAQWEPFLAATRLIEVAPVLNPAFSEAVQYLHKHNLEILTSSNVAVSLYDEAFSGKINTLQRNLVIMAAIVTALTGAGFWFVGRFIAAPLNRVRDALNAVSQGDVSATVSVSSQDEIGQIAHSYSETQQYLTEMAASANRIAEGDLGTEVEPRSAEDTLGNAFVRMQDYLSSTAGVAASIADGDLTVQARAQSERDELGVAFERMARTLREVMGEAGTAAGALNSAKDELARVADEAAMATTEVARASGQVAEGSGDQATAAQQVTEGVNDLMSAIDRVTEGAGQQSTAVTEATEVGNRVASAAEQMAESADGAADGAREAASTADEGSQMVERTVDGIGRIKSTVDAAADEIATLGERSAEIGKIVAVIEDIAAQTNLLALNAAIEAARAGEQGRGFAVVAEEVRQLAERVSAATKEIAELIGGVQAGVDASVKAMQEGAQEMDAGTRTAAEAGEALGRIMTAVQSVTGQVVEIAQGAQGLKATGQEMAQRLEQINTVAESNSQEASGMGGTAATVSESISSIAAVAEENSAASEQVSASTEQLTAQVEEISGSTHELGGMAGRLQEQIARFKLDGGAQLVAVELDTIAAEQEEEAA